MGLSEMRNDSELKTALQDCWKQIEFIYKQGRICSERHLQAEMFRVLRQHAIFETETGTGRYQIFIEPYIDKNNATDNGKTFVRIVIPDMIFTKEDKIVGIMEVKYIPHHFPKFEKDFVSLSEFYKKRGSGFEVKLEVDWQTGNWSEKQFRIDKNVLLIYCVIANWQSHIVSNPENVKEIWTKLIGSDQSFKNCLQLSGVINRESEKTTFHSIFLDEIYKPR